MWKNIEEILRKLGGCFGRIVDEFLEKLLMASLKILREILKGIVGENVKVLL